MPADILNGIWYILQGETGNGLLCCASAIPLVGDAVFKSGKYTIKGIIRGKKIIVAGENSYEISKAAFRSLGEITETLKKADANFSNELIDGFSKLLHNLPDEHLAEVKRLAQEIPIAKQSAVLTKLGGFSETERIAFLNDIKSSSGTLGSNLAKFEEGVVDAWKVLYDAGRTELKNNFTVSCPSLERSGNEGFVGSRL